tara:strand:- start:356 stop:724 length:369 start_codon:yes stop_codon:yes gene_type:complete
MIPTTELPLAWCEESTLIALTEKENVKSTLKRQREKKDETNRTEKKKKCEGDYEVAKEHFSDGDLEGVSKNGWKALLVHEFLDEIGLSKLKKDGLRELYCSRLGAGDQSQNCDDSNNVNVTD